MQLVFRCVKVWILVLVAHNERGFTLALMLRDVPGLKDTVQQGGAESTEQMTDNKVLKVARETDQTSGRGGAAEQEGHLLATPMKTWQTSIG